MCYRALTESLKAIEKGEPLPFPSHPALAAALQQGPNGDKSSLGNRALESCAYLVSYSNHNIQIFRALIDSLFVRLNPCWPTTSETALL